MKACSIYLLSQLFISNGKMLILPKSKFGDNVIVERWGMKRDDQHSFRLPVRRWSGIYLFRLFFAEYINMWLKIGIKPHSACFTSSINIYFMHLYKRVFLICKTFLHSSANVPYMFDIYVVNTNKILLQNIFNSEKILSFQNFVTQMLLCFI